MTILGDLARTLALAGLLGVAMGPAQPASATIVPTTISLKSFKQQLGLRNVRYLLGDAPQLGIISYTNRNQRTVVFRVDDSVFNEVNPFFIVIKATKSGEIIPRTLPIGLIIDADFRVSVSPT